MLSEAVRERILDDWRARDVNSAGSSSRGRRQSSHSQLPPWLEQQAMDYTRDVLAQAMEIASGIVLPPKPRDESDTLAEERRKAERRGLLVERAEGYAARRMEERESERRAAAAEFRRDLLRQRAAKEEAKAEREWLRGSIEREVAARARRFYEAEARSRGER